MSREVYKYRFNEKVPLKDVEESLLLAVLAVECLLGRARVRMEASFRLEKEKRVCVIEAGTEVGKNIARIFTGFLTHEFGEESFKVDRTSGQDEPQPVHHIAGRTP